MPTKTEIFFSKMNMLTYLAGMSSFWVEDIDLPATFVKVHRPVIKIIDVFSFLNILFQLASFFTQPNLTDKQEGDRYVIGCSMFLLYFYFTFIKRNTEKIKYLTRTLGVDLKLIYNDEETELEMIRKVKVYFSAIVGMCNMTLTWSAIEATTQHFKTGATFAPLITAWPDVTDHRTSASIVRIISYVLWWCTMIRVYAAFLIVILLAISLGMQYRNLCCYFHSLNAIFEDNELTQAKKEKKYEEGFKAGIKMHAMTLRCVPLVQESCHTVYTGQMSLNTSMLAVVLFQMVKTEHTVGNLVINIWTAASFLICTAVFMWSAGDITAEAENLDQAMYCSGWENCYGKTGLRVRKLAVLSMMLAQKRVALRSLNVIEISYQSYVTIVKSSYSVFSVFY